MAADNTLGAPTEGLGQTVTFAANGRGSVPQAQAMQRQAIRNTSTGGGAQRTVEALQIQAPKGDTTFQVLARLGGDLIKPQLEAERALAYAKGIQMASQGQAISEIVDEQPWYSKMFGSTSLVDGARAYTASTKATMLATEMETQMPELRKLGAEEMSKHLADRMIGAAKTGDAITDAMITQQVSSTLPAVAKYQAKEHLKYKTELFGDSMEANVLASLQRVVKADALHRDPSNTTEFDDVVGQELTALESLKAPADVPIDEFNKRAVSALVRVIDGGGHAAYDLIKTSHVYDSYSPAQQNAIDVAKSRATTRSKMDLPLSFSDTLTKFARLSNSPDGVSPDDIEKAGEEVNAEYTRITGDRSKYLDATAIAREKLGALAAEDQRILRANREAEAAQAHAVNAEAKAQLVLDVSKNNALAMMGGAVIGRLATEQQLTDAWATLRQEMEPMSTAGLPSEQAQAVAAGNATRQTKLLNTRIEQMDKDNPDKSHKVLVNSAIQLGITTGPASFYAAYKMHVEPMEKVSRRAALYYSGDGARAMELMSVHAKGRDLTEAQQHAAYQHVIRDLERPPVAASKKELAAVTAEFTSGRLDRFGQGLANIFGSDMTDIKNPAELTNIISPYLTGGREAEVDSKLAIQRAKEAGTLGMAGGYAWFRPPGQPDFMEAISAMKTNADIGSMSTNKAFELAVQQGIDKVGLVGSPTILQTGVDSQKQPMLTMMGSNKIGEMVVWTITPQMVRDGWVSHRKSKETNLEFGPKLSVPEKPTASPHSMTNRPVSLSGSW